MREIGSRSDVRLFTIKQGAGLNRSGKFQRFGASKGVSDILGVLAPSGRILAIELKVGRDRLSAEQLVFLGMVTRFGGLAIEARSVDDVLRYLP